MNRTKIKNYAPQARQDFLQAVTDRAGFYGLTSDRIEPVTVKGDVAIIGGQAFPRAVADKRKALKERVERDGFGPTMEALAYTWFNRFVAIRYMELHGYFEHGYRVLSNTDPARATPEILDQAEHVELPDLNRERVIELKLDGSKEAELFRMLLVAQCNALHSAMPFLFERIGDETELVLPESLLHSDSIVRKFVSGIDEEDWQEVEIIGWLYQFYISEKKDEVIGKVVASEDIPAATQLFTPNWIVKYLVQNTLGRLWMATYPQSPLKDEMKYYIEPAEQTPEVQEQLRAITPTSLNPEDITLLDPACGSAHILVEAYDVFRMIYQERGYRAKDIPRLILSKNLFGLEIDDRAAQLAAFALMMKARADDRRIFDGEVKPNVLALHDSRGIDVADITHALNSPINKDDVPVEHLFEEIEEERDGLFNKKALAEKGQVSQAAIASLLELFENAKTFGSLIQVPPKLAAKLPEVEKRLEDVLKRGDLTHALAHVLKPLIQQARMLARQYDVVVANPPYMGGRWMNPIVKTFSKNQFPDAYADLFAAFMSRGMEMLKDTGRCGMVTMQSWMFLSSFEDLRHRLLTQHTLESMAHLGPRAFSTISGEVVTVTAFVLHRHSGSSYQPTFLRLIDGEENEKIANFHNPACVFQNGLQSRFLVIPGYPIAYWVSEPWLKAYEAGTLLGDVAQPAQGLATGSNDRFLRCWWEASIENIGFSCIDREDAKRSGRKWFPYNKGGEYRKWFGNNTHVVNWKDDGKEIRAFVDDDGHLRSRPQNTQYYFRPSLTWSFVSSTSFAVRCCDRGFVFDIGGSSVFPPVDLFRLLAGFMCSKVAYSLMQLTNPTLNFQVGNVASLPLPFVRLEEVKNVVERNVDVAVELARGDWNEAETSWDFTQHVYRRASEAKLVSDCDLFWSQFAARRKEQMRVAEENINSSIIHAFSLGGELSSDVTDDQITLYRPNREEDIKRLISYVVSCTMGRYSLDKPGLIYAHCGNMGFDPGQYRTFPADPDGIVPVMEADWFADDATNRFVEFLGVAWPREGLDENLKFVADALGPSKGEQPRDTIRRYLATGFTKHHLQTYKRRPIYWLFSSGKQRAFQCLVYLHRYHDGTLARMRTEYVIPLQGKLASRIDQLAGDIQKATSTSHRKTLTQERDKLIKQQAELQAYDEKLRHYADMRITLDLDDGVKVNYGKFGDLLAEVKAVTGGREEE
jgi:type II restriction/modification system DNA methylase subunit YeeA